MELSDFFTEYNKAAIAFSGGCDSAYLMYEAKKYGADIHGYYVKTEFQPAFELCDAKRLATELDIPLSVIEMSVLSRDNISENPSDRCYHCKKALFTEIKRHAVCDGYDILLDGTNATDDISDRPGTAAAAELRVLSPLRECGLTKEMVRRSSHEGGLFTWDKPAYSCLATRIAAGERITREKLSRVETAENYLFSLGFSDLRVRTRGTSARLQLHEGQQELYFQLEDKILGELKRYFDTVTLDSEVRR